MQVVIELLAAAVVAAAAAALSLFGMDMARSEAGPVQLIQKTQVQTNMIVVTPPAKRTDAIPC